MRRRVLALIVLASLAAPVVPAYARTSAEIVAGRVVVDATRPTEFWFVHPGLKTREQLTANSWLAIAARSKKSISLKQFDAIPAADSASAADQRLVNRLQGRLLLDVSTGVVWYVSPHDGRRYEIRSPQALRQVLGALQTGISARRLATIPTGDSSARGDTGLRNRFSGQALFSVSDGSLWYVSPKNTRRYPVNTEAQAWHLLRTQVIGITAKNLKKIPPSTQAIRRDPSVVRAFSGYFVSPSYAPEQIWYVSPKTKQRHVLTAETAIALLTGQAVSITPRGLSEIRMTGEADLSTRSVVTSRGTFSLTLLSSNLALPGVRILSLGGNNDTCVTNCITRSVGQYASLHSGIAAVNGGYFCPAASGSCAGKTDSYYGPLYHSAAGVMINNDQIPTNTYPMLVWDTNNQPYYFAQSSSFGSAAQFQSTYGVTIQAAIANWPLLIEHGVDVSGQQLLDNGQRFTKTTRVGLGVKGKTLVFAVVTSATVLDLAAVMATLGLDYAFNLDGGSSTALWRYGAYAKGPGRTVPNALVIQRLP